MTVTDEPTYTAAIDPSLARHGELPDVLTMPDSRVYIGGHMPEPRAASGLPRSVRDLLGTVRFCQWATDDTVEVRIGWSPGTERWRELLDEGLAELFVEGYGELVGSGSWRLTAWLELRLVQTAAVG